MADSKGFFAQLPVIDGSIYGIVSFFAGYFTTLVLVLAAEGDQLTDDFIEGAGWVYYNAQFAAVELRPPGGQGASPVESVTINYLTGSGPEQLAVTATELPAVVYHVIPVVVLLAGGYMLATDLGAETPVEGIVAGGSLAFGTVFLSFAGGVLFEVGTIRPNILQGIFFVGILYPLVFGALGGIIGTRLSVEAWL